MYDFMVLGGDMRQSYLADILIKQGYRVVKYLLPEIPGEQKGKPGSNLQMAADLATYNSKDDFIKKLKKVSCILAPIPITKDNKSLNHKEKSTVLTLDELYENLDSSQIIIGGCLPKWFDERCQEKGCQCFDYMKDESLAVRNAVATAEGVLAEAIFKYPGNLHDCKCLVLGFGKCGKVLAEKLKGLSAKVTVCIRKDSDAAWAKALGYEAVYFDCDESKPIDCLKKQMETNSNESYKSLRECIGGFPLIFNTVPYVVLNRELLSRIEKDGMIFDIASAPGGVDYEAAKRIGVKAELCPSLPGIYAPKASAEILSEVIKRVIRKE